MEASVVRQSGRVCVPMTAVVQRTALRQYMTSVQPSLFVYLFVFWPRSMQDLSFPTRGQTFPRRPAVEVQKFNNHWTTREVPKPRFNGTI